MSDTYTGECKACHIETDLIQGLCQECKAVCESAPYSICNGAIGCQGCIYEPEE